ncbi:uncharacterized protein EI90DRAFT_3290682 [Cantharellus anzutake]|uniref:uncharacterized protein n=1 Tax=Cantharellus anzutake TaxID=1750568 RepID=UPI001907F5B6|nr:uncharacterized protein EI90DRAFT_3290682 [Cantharellus anzutake]KAF8328160.1 hypothetical protein EI90DRAFT_3290682 [Cantharellus anzutake]
MQRISSKDSTPYSVFSEHPKSATMALAQASFNVGVSAAALLHSRSNFLRSPSNPSLPLRHAESGVDVDADEGFADHHFPKRSKARKSIFGGSPFRKLTLSRKATRTDLGGGSSMQESPRRRSASGGTSISNESVGAQFLSKDPFMASTHRLGEQPQSHLIPALTLTTPAVIAPVPWRNSTFIDSSTAEYAPSQYVSAGETGDSPIGRPTACNSLDEDNSSPASSLSSTNLAPNLDKVAVQVINDPGSARIRETEGPTLANTSVNSGSLVGNFQGPPDAAELPSSTSFDMFDRGRAASLPTEPPSLLVSPADTDLPNSPVSLTAHKQAHLSTIVPPDGGPTPRRSASTPRLSVAFEPSRHRSMSLFHSTAPKTPFFPTSQTGDERAIPQPPSKSILSASVEGTDVAHLRPPISTGQSSLVWKLTKSFLFTGSSLSPATTQSPAIVETRRSSSSLERPSTPLSDRKCLPPPIEDRETPELYLKRLIAAVSKAEIASILASRKEPFYTTTLQLYLSKFDFRSDPLDIALRKFLMDVGLPRETQQIDRVVEAFSARYETCNPGLFANNDHAYILSFSLIMLHTDAFNPSNKTRMRKADYVKNTRLPGVATEVLECFYDNTTFAPFIFVEDNLDITGQFGYLPDTPVSIRNRSSTLVSGLKPGPNPPTSSRRRLDPYVLISEFMDPSYHPVLPGGVDRTLTISERIQRFQSAPRLGVLEQTRRRSIPLLYGATSDLPSPESHQKFGMTKLDVMDEHRKASNRKWRQWRVILTGSQLLFFRDLSLLVGVKERDLHEGTVLIDMKPDEVISLHDAVALFDHSYHMDDASFRFVLASGRQFIVKAESREEALEWMCLINFASTFRSLGLRIQFTSDYIAPNQQVLAQVHHDVKPDTPEILSSVADGAASSGFNFPNKSNSSGVDEGSTIAAPGGLDTYRAAWDSHTLRHRVGLLRGKLDDLNKKIVTTKTALDAEMRLIRNFEIMTPFVRTTRDRIQAAVISQAKRVQQLRLEMARLCLYQTVLHDDLDYSQSLLPSPSASHPANDESPASLGAPSKPRDARSAELAVSSLSISQVSKRPESSSGSFYSALDVEFADAIKGFPHTVVPIPTSPLDQPHFPNLL